MVFECGTAVRKGSGVQSTGCTSVVDRTEVLSPTNGGFKALNPIQWISALGRELTATELLPSDCPQCELSFRFVTKARTRSLF